ncbi:hypothetical protein C8F01DRAFT_1158662 [Mycena amicta]|nr:hypothetical protein C8F01DRAFT_1158662 [Mycena amicta]
MKGDADDDYESDTGERDTPTCAHFLQDRPVDKFINIGHRRVLNRAGRATVRIVAAHGWDPLDIARIFGEPPNSIRRAIDNISNPPRDNVWKDYDYVDADFRLHFPPKIEIQDTVSAPASCANTPTISPFVPSSMRSASTPVLPRKTVWFEPDTSSRSASPLPSPSTPPLTSTSFQPVNRTKHFPFKSRPPSVAMLNRLKLQLSLSLPPSHPCVAESRIAAANRARSNSQSIASAGNVAIDVDTAPPPSDDEIQIVSTNVKPERAPLIRHPLPFRRKIIKTEPTPEISHMHPAAPAPLPSVPRPRPNEREYSDSKPISHPSSPSPFISRTAGQQQQHTHQNVPASVVSHAQFLVGQGFTSELMLIVARWPVAERREAFERLFFPLAENDTSKSRSAELLDLERDIDALVVQENLPPLVLPRPNDSETTLDAFLANSCFAIDLSPHTALLTRHGFTLERLRSLKTGASGWGRKEVRELIWRVLAGAIGKESRTGGPGMTPLEILALEFAFLRREFDLLIVVAVILSTNCHT